MVAHLQSEKEFLEETARWLGDEPENVAGPQGMTRSGAVQGLRIR